MTLQHTHHPPFQNFIANALVENGEKVLLKIKTITKSAYRKHGEHFLELFFFVSEHFRHDENEKGHQLNQVVLHRGTGQQQLPGCLVKKRNE